MYWFQLQLNHAREKESSIHIFNTWPRLLQLLDLIIMNINELISQLQTYWPTLPKSRGFVLAITCPIDLSHALMNVLGEKTRLRSSLSLASHEWPQSNQIGSQEISKHQLPTVQLLQSNTSKKHYSPQMQLETNHLLLSVLWSSWTYPWKLLAGNDDTA